jgi:hypothetical protein
LKRWPSRRRKPSKTKEGTIMASKLVLPRVHVMVLCDEIESCPDEEEAFNLSGVRTKIRADAFPYNHAQLCVYLQLTGHAGTTRCHVTVVDAKADEVVYVTPSRVIHLQGPLVVLPVVHRVRNCKFPTPGLYYVQAFCDLKLLCERPLLLFEE